MRKRKKGKTLSRSADQRKALVRTMIRSFVHNSSIKTTLAKAKYLKPKVEKLIGTIQRKLKRGDDLTVIIRYLRKNFDIQTSKKLIEIAKRYQDRAGGFLRVIKLVNRQSDKAKMAILEWVEEAGKSSEELKKKKSPGKSNSEKKIIPESKEKKDLTSKVKEVKEEKAKKEDGADSSDKK